MLLIINKRLSRILFMKKITIHILIFTNDQIVFKILIFFMFGHKLFINGFVFYYLV